MNTTIDAAIKTLAAKAGSAATAPESMNLAQAALNLAHTKQVLLQVAFASQPPDTAKVCK